MLNLRKTFGIRVASFSPTSDTWGLVSFNQAQIVVFKLFWNLWINILFMHNQYLILWSFYSHLESCRAFVYYS